MKITTAVISLVMLLGVPSWASNCSDMAAFNTQIKDFLETKSISETLKADVRELAVECEKMHGTGEAVSSISSCSDALKLIMVN